MAILEFPPLHKATEDGLLAIGGDLEVESLILAYSSGIFPWPISEEYPLAWFAPDPRGIIFTDKLHISKSLKKFLRKNPFDIRYNTVFEDVIRNCAETPNRKEQGTWITEEIIEAYLRLHQRGFAYSVEAFLDEKLVGGLYGVCIGNMFTGESMFYKEDNASKVCFLAICQRLAYFNIPILDTQMVTEVIAMLGGEDISRDSFMKIMTPLLNRTPIQNFFSEDIEFTF